MASSAGIRPSAPLVGAPGNWPLPAQLFNLDIDDSARYADLLNFMNLIETINRSLLGYIGPDAFGTARWDSILLRYNTRRPALLPNERPISTARSLVSAWSRRKREMLQLINEHNARIAAPIPVVASAAAAALTLIAPMTVFSFNSVY